MGGARTSIRAFSSSTTCNCLNRIVEGSIRKKSKPIQLKEEIKLTFGALHSSVFAPDNGSLIGAGPQLKLSDDRVAVDVRCGAGGDAPKLKLLLSIVGTGAAPPELKLSIDGVGVVGAESVGFKAESGARLLPLGENGEEDCCLKVNPEGASGKPDIVGSVLSFRCCEMMCKKLQIWWSRGPKAHGWSKIMQEKTLMRSQ